MAVEKKEEFMSQLEHYRAVLEDLQKQRDLLRLKITEIDQAIASLHRLIPEEAKQQLPPPNLSTTAIPVPQAGRFSGMGVRWAILNLLGEIATRPMSTGEIAAALQEGGITSSAASFAGNVSAVLSVMSKQRGEVVSTPEGWMISGTGRSVWAHIRGKREAEQQQREMLISSNVQ